KITEPHQILVKVRATSICGSDLHIWRGTLDQAMGKGHSTLGHELSGEVIETGAEGGRFSKGDRVSMGYSASCGDCYQCRHHNTAHCQVTK
ncbi:alcohol dehydrogenase catalytic domain-containing protein, partial [Acinetobacter baumannii]|uniref:alcohol dehydrogenase catalytic domain-containing protein n=1 Tax=Acinetobacter baumannii TaxID=470 RepID=UPI0013D82CFF